MATIIIRKDNLPNPDLLFYRQLTGISIGYMLLGSLRTRPGVLLMKSLLNVSAFWSVLLTEKIRYLLKSR